MIDGEAGNIEYHFGKFHLHPTRPELWSGEETIQLTRKRYDILLFLVRNHGKPLSKDELIRAIWPTKEVEESNLSNQIHSLRRIIEEDPANPRLIVTIPGVGYQFCADVTIRRQPQLLAATTPIPEPSRGRRWGARRLLFLCSFIVIAGLLLLWLDEKADLAKSTPNPVPVTHYPGMESYPSLSPNGQFLAFTWDSNALKKTDLYVKQIDGGDPIRITTNPYEEILPTWSPDGKRIAFLREPEVLGEPLRLMVVPALGGMEREVARVGWGLDWSPAGDYLAVVNLADRGFGPGIHLIEVEGTGHRAVTTRARGETYFDSNPRFSPDGKSLAFVRWRSDANGEIHTVDLQTGELRQLTFDKAVIGNSSIQWTSDSREILFVSNRSGSFILWKMLRTGSKPQPIFSLHLPIDHYSISRETNDLVFVPKLDDTLIEVISNNVGEAGTKIQKDGVRCSLDSSRAEFGPRFSPDGDKLVFTSNRTGWDEIWVANSDCTQSRQLTNLKSYGVGSPRWSPDGTRIVFDRRVDGRPEIFTITSGGSDLRQLTNTIGSTRPFWAPDGQSIYFTLFTQGETDQEQIWKIDINSGAISQVTRNGGIEAVISPDGKRLYYSNGHYLYQKDLPSGAETLVPGLDKVQIDRYWDVTRSAIFFVPFYQGEEPAIYRFDLESRQKTLVRRLDRKPFAWQIGLSVSSDERMAAISLINQHLGDILMVRDWK